MTATSGDARAERSLTTEIAQDLLDEFPHVAAGRILAVVVRTMADLRRIAVTTETAASADDYRRVLTDMARNQLKRGRAH